MKTKAFFFTVLLFNLPMLLSANKERELNSEKSEFFSAVQNGDFTSIFEIFKKNQEAFSWYKEDLITLMKEEDSAGFEADLLDYVNSKYKNRKQLSEDTLNILNISMQRRLGSYLKKNVHDQDEIKEIIKNLNMVYRFHLKLAIYETIAFSAYPISDVRERSFRALSIMDTDRVFPIIMKLANSQRIIERIYALDAFYYINDDRTIPLMIGALKDHNKSVRYYAIKTLDRLKRLEAIPFFVRIVQSDVNNEVRIKAIASLKKFKPASGFYPLIKAISDFDKRVREAALKAVLEYKNKKACYHISAQLAKEDQDNLKMMQVKGLLALNNSGGGKGLAEVIKNEKNIEILRWAIFSAGKLKDLYAFRPVILTLKHELSEIRSEAADALAQYKSSLASTALLEVLYQEKEEYSVQAAAVMALKEIRSKAILAKLLELSESHPNDYVRAQIKEVLFELIKYR